MSLRKKIHTELINENQTRKETILIESKIINSQFSTLKNCDTIDCVLVQIMEKADNFKKRNFSKKLIQEGVFEIMTSLFGQLDDDIWEEAKSRLANKVINSLSVPEEYKECIKEKILKTPNEEVTKLMSDTEFFADKVAIAYIECFQDDALKSTSELQGPMAKQLYDGIKSLTNDSGFIARVSGKASPDIDKSLEGVRKKEEEIADKLKAIVLGK